MAEGSGERMAHAEIELPPNSATALSLHGGGFLGYFSALVLRELARQKGKLVSGTLGASFDIIGGTSVGAILAAAVACDVPPLSVVSLMRTHGSEVFPPRRFGAHLPGIFAPRFSAGPLRQLLEKVLEDRTLGDVQRALVIPAVDETNGRPVLFRSHDRAQHGIALVDAVLASAAAPGFFPLHVFGDRQFTDGGLVANAPDLIVASDLTAFFRVPVSRQRILSIGTPGPGRPSPWPPSAGQRWGMLDWIYCRGRLQGLLMNAQVDLQADILRKLRPASYLLICDELAPEHAAQVHMARADAMARILLAKSAAAAMQRASRHDIVTTRHILRHRGRRLAFRTIPGRPGEYPYLANPGHATAPTRPRDEGAAEERTD